MTPATKAAIQIAIESVNEELRGGQLPQVAHCLGLALVRLQEAQFWTDHAAAIRNKWREGQQ